MARELRAAFCTSIYRVSRKIETASVRRQMAKCQARRIGSGRSIKLVLHAGRRRRDRAGTAGEHKAKVAETLTNDEILKKGRVHPIQILISAKTYESGHGVRGSGEWKPVPKVIDSLHEAFYKAFHLVEPTGKRFYLGLDISGSMWSGVVAGVVGLTPAVASGAMAMTVVKTEAEYYAAGFTFHPKTRRFVYS